MTIAEINLYSIYVYAESIYIYAESIYIYAAIENTCLFLLLVNILTVVST